MRQPLTVTCPRDGDAIVYPGAVLADFEHGRVAFTCPHCQDLVCRDLPTDWQARDRLIKALRVHEVPAVNLEPVNRRDVCGGRPLTTGEAWATIEDIGVPGALELYVNRWAAP
jgi:hypothetical protein